MEHVLVPVDLWSAIVEAHEMYKRDCPNNERDPVFDAIEAAIQNLPTQGFQTIHFKASVDPGPDPQINGQSYWKRV